MPSGSADDGITRNPRPVVCGDVAPSEPPIEVRWLRGKPVQVSKIPKITQIPCTGNHAVGIIRLRNLLVHRYWAIDDRRIYDSVRGTSRTSSSSLRG